VTRTTRSRAASRPTGLGHGVPALLIAWAAAGMIALLTGAVAVVILLAMAAVAGAASVMSGWSALRGAQVDSVIGGHLGTVGDPMVWHVRAHTRRPVRLDLHARTSAGTVRVASGALHDGYTVFDGNTPGRGVHSTVEVELSSGGRLGLLWWRRREQLPIEPLAVAPRAAHEHAPLARDAASTDGVAVTHHHAGRDEIDGVRVWRDGDELAGVHWPSTLRAGEFVVRQRLREHDEQWIVEATTGTPDPAQEAARLRHTLETGLADGARVAVRVDNGAAVHLPDREAVLAFVAAFDPHDPAPPGLPWWRRPLFDSPEPHTHLPRAARWLAAVATALTITMALQPLGYNIGQIGLVVAGTLAAAAATTLRRPLPPTVRQVAGIAIGVAIGASLVDLTAVDNVMTSLRFLLPQLLVTLVTVQGFECVDRRGGRVSLACSGLLAAYSAGIRVDAALANWLAITVLVIAVGMRLTTQGDDAPSPASAPTGGAPVRGRWRGTIRATGAVTVASAVCLGVLALIPVPRGPAQLTLPSWLAEVRRAPRDGELIAPDGSPLLGGATAARAGDGSTGGSYPGFTETLDTALRGALGDEVVLRVRAPSPDFWRGQTFTTFDGRRWTVAEIDEGLGMFRSEGVDHTIPRTYGDVSYAETEDLIQTFYPQVDLPNLIFAAYRPTRVLLDAPLFVRADGAVRSGVALTAGSAYTVVSARTDTTADTLRVVADVGSYDTDPAFLQVPETVTARTRELAGELRAGAATTYDFILAVQAWLAEHTVYDLDAPVPRDDADAVDHFLFEGQRGFCEQIATATAILLRLEGVPARLATGYVPSSRDPVSGVWISRAKDAHAWVEVRFPNLGWVPFDPTADVPLAGDSSPASIGGDLLRGALALVSEHVATTVVVVVAVVLAAGGRLLVRRLLRRRARGRWGLLQDRFTTAALERGAPDNACNADLAAAFDVPDEAHRLAGELDAAAFACGWTDDDERYEHARQTVAVLERRR
jgi:transglutaminase-like putative cysteine protease